MSNPYPSDSIWIGRDYENQANYPRGALILMESTWGINSDSEDPQWIRSFYRKVYKDNSFADLFRIMEERDRSRNEVYDLSSDCLEQWFNQFAFYNYVAKPVGETSASTAKHRNFMQAREPFRKALEIIRPTGVWVIGKVQSSYSVSIIKEYGAKYVVGRHMSKGGFEACRESWPKFKALMKRINDLRSENGLRA